jgi:hypothetical protein
MDPRYRRAFLCGLLGVTLLANPLYLYPEGVSYETTYTYEAAPIDYLPYDSQTTTEFKSCGWNPLQSAECAFVEEMADGDAVEVRLDADRGVDDEFWSYDYVRANGRYYEPNATLEENDTLEGDETGESRTLTLSLEPVSEETVKRAMSEDLDGVPRYAREALRNGSVNVTEEHVGEPDRFYVRHEGRYYVVEPVTSERVPTGWGYKEPSDVQIDAMRLGGWIAGIALIWRAGEWSERGRRATKRNERRGRSDRRR